MFVELSEATWHRLTADQIYRTLNTSPEGLETSQIQKRLKIHGRNRPPQPSRHVIRRMVYYLFGGFGTLLLVAAILVLIAWKPLGSPPAPANLALGVVLLLIFASQATFNAYQDWSTSSIMSSIKTMLPEQTLVVRDGNSIRIPVVEIVPGDMVQIAMGDKIPADIRLLQVTSELKFDRSILTGESFAVEGAVDMTSDNYLESNNIALQSTVCVAGSGSGVCVATGVTTAFARIASLSGKTRTVSTTLQKELFRFVIIIVVLALSTGALILILW